MSRNDALEKYQEQFPQEKINEVRKAILRRMAVMDTLQNLESQILDEVVETPATYAASFNVAAGSPFALSHGFTQLSLARPGAEVEGFMNVIAVGASSRPGNGVPLVLIGAKQVAGVALQKLRRANVA